MRGVVPFASRPVSGAAAVVAVLAIVCGGVTTARAEDGPLLLPPPPPGTAATRPATQPSAATQPLATPREALERFVSLLRAGRPADARAMVMSPEQEAIAGEADLMVQSVAEPLAAGRATIEYVDERTEGGLTLLVVRSVRAGAVLHDYTTVYAVDRDGEPRIILGGVERHALTEPERAAIAPLEAWSKGRIRELMLEDLKRVGIK